MTDQTENPIPTQQDDIKSVLQDTLFQQVQTLLNFTRTEGFALQIPNTDTHILAGPLARIAAFLRQDAGICMTCGAETMIVGGGERVCVHCPGDPANVVTFDSTRAALASQSQAAQPTELADERPLFEAHMREQGASDDDLKMPYGDGCYFWEKTADAWGIWQARAHIAGTSQAKQPSEPTDISQRLRERAGGGYTAVRVEDGALMLAAAAEIERYYGGMLAWKQTAEKKDRDWNAERMGRVNDRIAERTSQATKVQAEPVAWGLLDIQEPELTNDPEFAAYWSRKGRKVTPLYAAPVESVASVAKEATRDAETTEKAKPIAAAVRAAERVDAMHKGVVGVFAAIKAEHLAQANVLPPFAAPASQQDAGWCGAICGGEHDRTTGTMYITVKLPKDGLPVELLTIGEAVVIAPASKPHTAGSAKGGITNTESGSDVATTTSTVSAQPVAYVNGNELDNMLDDCTATIQSNPSGWRKTPLYRAAPSSTEGAQKAPEEVRNRALEEAAKLCEVHGASYDNAHNRGLGLAIELANVAGECAYAIRALRTSSTDQANADTGSAA